jgi:hypothetical protein
MAHVIVLAGRRLRASLVRRNVGLVIVFGPRAVVVLVHVVTGLGGGFMTVHEMRARPGELQGNQNGEKQYGESAHGDIV